MTVAASAEGVRKLIICIIHETTHLVLKTVRAEPRASGSRSFKATLLWPVVFSGMASTPCDVLII